jgi:DNA topoisomerase-1
MNEYCYDLKSGKLESVPTSDLRKFITRLYKGSEEPYFSDEKDMPFVTVNVPSKGMCIKMTSRGKKNIERIEEIHKKLTSGKLKYKTLVFNKPYLFGAEDQDWWDEIEDEDNDGGKKKTVLWDSILQQGPYFGHIYEPYQPLGASLKYDGKNYKLNSKEEEVASFYAKRIISEESGGVVDKWTKDNLFNKNFMTGFVKYLTSENKKVFKDIKKIGWGNLISKIKAVKSVKDLTQEEKRQKLINNQEKIHHYGYAVLDGKIERVGNFTVEPQAIFYGRGANPNRGKIKSIINPEDVVLNIGKNDPIPKPPPGHKWGGVVHEHKKIFLASWTDTITNKTKYVQFAAEGKLKGMSDLKKYEKARKLHMHIEAVRTRYMVDASSQDDIKRQLGTVLWLIDHHGVRVGGDKKDDKADTVGASTLRVDHVKIEAPDKVIFDFLGKDSIRYYKKLTAPQVIWNNFKSFLEGRDSNAQVFGNISAKSINAYLKEFDRAFSAKVFRTRLASNIMYEALKDVHIPEGKISNAQIKATFNKANVKVAEVLNHTRNVSLKAKEGVKKDQDKLKELQKEKKELKKAGKSLKSIEERIEKKEIAIDNKTNVMSVAINTSLTNYIDPRLVVAWTMQEDTQLSAIYTGALMKKFKWAIDTTDENWDWLNSPLMGNPELAPSNSPNVATIISEEENKHKKDKPKRKPKYKPKPPQVINVPDEPRPIEVKKGIGSTEDYKLLLDICKKPNEYILQIGEVSRDAMNWIYPMCKYALNKKGRDDIIANKYIVKYYESAFPN